MSYKIEMMDKLILLDLVLILMAMVALSIHPLVAVLFSFVVLMVIAIIISGDEEDDDVQQNETASANYW